MKDKFLGNIKINGRTWKVIITGKCIKNNETWNYAEVDYQKQEIWINSKIKKDNNVEAFFHELCHVFLMPTVGTQDYRKDKLDIEIICNLIGNGLSEIINNKDYKNIISKLIKL